MPRKSIAKEVKRVRIEEAADALVLLLKVQGATCKGTTVKKAFIIKNIEHYVHQVRRSTGVMIIPTVLHREVKAANETFCRNNWKAIRETAGQMGYYIIWNPPGENLGIRLGTLEEYQNQQALIMNITASFAKFHNERAETIRDSGEKAGDLQVKLRRQKRG